MLLLERLGWWQLEQDLFVSTFGLVCICFVFQFNLNTQSESFVILVWITLDKWIPWWRWSKSQITGYWHNDITVPVSVCLFFQSETCLTWKHVCSNNDRTDHWSVRSAAGLGKFQYHTGCQNPAMQMSLWLVHGNFSQHSSWHLLSNIYEWWEVVTQGLSQDVLLELSAI